MSKHWKTFYRYSSCFKEKAVREISSGSSISEVCRRYDIRGTGTVQYWVKKYGRPELFNTVIRVKMRGEDDRMKAMATASKYLIIIQSASYNSVQKFLSC